MMNLLYAFYAGLGSFAFGILFNIRGKNLIFAGISGMIGWLTYLTLLDNGNSTNVSLFGASLIVSLLSEILARILKSPVTIYVIAGIIPLVPGSGMYNTMFECITGSLDKAISLGFSTLINAGSIALGIVFVSSIGRFLFKKKEYRLLHLRK